MQLHRHHAGQCASLIASFALFAAILACGPTTHGTGTAGGTDASPPAGASPADTALKPAGTIPMPRVEGRIDHLAIDVAGQRLFVAALGNDTVEVIDLKSGRDVHSIAGLHEPQGIAYIPDADQLVVANGASGTVEFFGATSFERVRSVPLGDDADNVRYDASTKALYVGYGGGAVAAIDAVTGERVADAKVSGHPESLALEKATPRIYVNVPDASQIAVVDRSRRSVVATWPVKGAGANFPLALDEASHRLFVGCRRPARLLVYDTEKGIQTAAHDIGGDADDVFYDAARHRIYVACGDGHIDVVDQRGPDAYALAGRVATAGGARTCLWVPELGRLFVAVPHRGGQQAEIRVYEAASIKIDGRLDEPARAKAPAA